MTKGICQYCGKTVSRVSTRCKSCSNEQRLISDSMRVKCREANLGEKSHNWKGNSVSYRVLHKWAQRHKVKPDLCERCNTRPAMDLANISGEYKRDLTDYEYLCRKCHMTEDGRIHRLNEARMDTCVASKY